MEMQTPCLGGLRDPLENARHVCLPHNQGYQQSLASIHLGKADAIKEGCGHLSPEQVAQAHSEHPVEPLY